MLYPGLYEQVINNALNSELAKIPEALQVHCAHRHSGGCQGTGAVSDRRGAEGS